MPPQWAALQSSAASHLYQNLLIYFKLFPKQKHNSRRFSVTQCRTWTAEKFAGNMENPRVDIESNQIGTQRVVISHGRSVVDARVTQQRSFDRQLEVDERQVRARLRFVEQAVSAT